MTKREMSVREGGTSGEPFPQPASRLRRALDIARRAAAGETGPADEDAVAPTDAPHHLEPDAEPAPSQRSAPARLRAIESALESAQSGSTARRRSGRGLDALIPVEPVGPVAVEDAWQASAQGWVRTGSGRLQWRPIVATTPGLDEWVVSTYLGVVSGQELVEAGDLTANRLAAGRREATDRMVAEAVGRGAHAVLGAAHTLVRLESGYLVGVTGTAVTLRNR